MKNWMEMKWKKPMQGKGNGWENGEKSLQACYNSVMFFINLVCCGELSGKQIRRLTRMLEMGICHKCWSPWELVDGSRKDEESVI